MHNRKIQFSNKEIKVSFLRVTMPDMDNFCILRKINSYFFAGIAYIFRSLCGPDFIQYYCTVAVLAVFIPS
jgi:hypothetical protein